MKTSIEHDPELDVFDRGCLQLKSEGRTAGHIFATLSSFRTPTRPLTKQDWVWLLVVWADGRREMPIEEYPPFTAYVRELLEGRFRWEGTTYEAVWVADAERVWREVGVSDADF